MHQLTHNLKNGHMEILEVPFPALGNGQILVRNHYSVISAGTEGKRVKDAKLGYIGKARSRQKEVKQVLNTIKTQGVVTTYKLVMNKLNAPSALGYSCAGEVVEVGDGVSEFQVGDWVSCGGSAAIHGEIVAVPRNLCVNVPKSVELQHAAFATVASIALQGIRQSELRLGEYSVVIGLGLIGLITIQLLKAAGIKAIGLDIDSRQVELAKAIGADLALEISREDLEGIVLDFTKALGVDAVIITAGTSSLDPINLAGKLCRHKGKVVVVGAIPTGFDRESYYKKELELRMSTSYGPGRYDPVYEEKGIDYPVGYVRWTERRNMQGIIDLIDGKKIQLEKLITHIFDFKDAVNAYQMILEKSEPFVGILLKYETNREIKTKIKINEGVAEKSSPTVGFIGAGSFAQNVLLPVVQEYSEMIGVATARSNNARYIAEKYGFQFCTGNADEIINDDRINTVFVATRHNLHGEYVLKALNAKKNVFVEKPLALALDEFNEIQSFYTSISSPLSPKIMVGFNRRFCPHIQKIKTLFSENQPKAINYRINAGIIPSDHWVQDPEIGGGRIIGELCHFIDLTMFLAGSKIDHLSANVLNTSEALLDTLVVNLAFENGSIASISYFSNGNKSLPKESLEIFEFGNVAIIDDFKQLTLYQGDKRSTANLKKQDKGHREEVKRFLASVRHGQPTPIPPDEIFHVTSATFKVIESIKCKKTMQL